MTHFSLPLDSQVDSLPLSFGAIYPGNISGRALNVKKKIRRSGLDKSKKFGLNFSQVSPERMLGL